MSNSDSSHAPAPSTGPDDPSRDDSAMQAAGGAGKGDVQGTVKAPEDQPAPDQLPYAHLPPDQQPTVISKPGSSGEPAIVPAASPFKLGRALEGQDLGHFHLEEFVGGGGMGAVFRATDTQLGRTVAVKVLSRDQGDDDETVRRFKNEAQSAARLDHENIARVYYVGADGGWNFIVFEFIDGVNIRDLVTQKGPLSLESAISYTLQVAEALAHASHRDVVHRDIKPSNVLITSHGRAKLVDMGLARLHHVESSEADLTASGVTLGTFDYISPEQARDPRVADVRSDLYSLGCTLYYMVTGRPPFPEGTVLQKLLSHSSDPPPDPRQFRPDLPDEIAAVLNRLLAKHPEDRYQEPNELVGELLLAAEQLGLSVADRGASVWITRDGAKISAWERHLPWVVPVVVLIAIVLGLELFWSRTSWEVDRPPRFDRSAETEQARVEQPTPGNGADARSDRPSKPSTDDAAIDGAPGKSPADEKTDGKSPATDAARDGDGKGDPTDAANTLAQWFARFDPRSVLAPGQGDGGAGISATPDVFGGIWAIGPDDHQGAMIAAVADPAVKKPADNGTPTGVAEDTKVLIVGEGGEASLAAACKKIRDLPELETIELRFNGRRVEPPIALSNRKVTIRGGMGFSPILVFRLKAGEPAKDRHGMISVFGGELILEDVSLEMDIPKIAADPWSDPIERWALFELQSVDMVKMVNCTMTIRNAAGGRSAYHQRVAFFDVKPDPDVEPASPEEARGAKAPLRIDLWHCIARGEATYLRLDNVLPLRLTWSNGLLATTERLLTAGGSKTSLSDDEHIEIDLDHVTAVMDGGLCLLTNEETAPHQLTVAIRCNDSILMTDSMSALIEQRGVDDVDQFRRRLLVRGRDNFYQQTDVFWRIEPADETADVQEMDFAGWSRQWEDEMQPKRLVKWLQLPEVELPVHLHTPLDYALTDHPSNPAIRSAGDHSNAGFNAEQLPEPPLPAASPKAPEPTRPPDSLP